MQFQTAWTSIFNVGAKQEQDNTIFNYKWYLEDLAVGGAQHDDAAELGERDAGEHGGAHGGERVRGAAHAPARARHAERVHQVRAELHRDAHRHHLHVNMC